MTIDERIKLEEKAIKDMQFKEEALDGLPGYMVTKEDYEECRKSVNEHQELINWLKELKAHRETWTVVANAMKECSYKIWHEFGEYIGEDCEQLEIVNLKTALDILEDCRPKEGRLKELQIDRSNLTSQSLSDLLVHCENENERLQDRTNELEKELQAHKEAWKGLQHDVYELHKILFNMKPQHRTTTVAGDILGLIEAYRPKDGDTK